jgi:transposase InsO family protein
VKTIAATLGVARSNLVERKDGARPRRGPQTRVGDIELAADIRRLVDARPTYGYRRIAALLKRERRSAGAASVNAKRVYRLMKKHGLLLARHTGAGGHASTTARSPRSARIFAGVRTRWSSRAGTVRSSVSPLPSTAMTGK